MNIQKISIVGHVSPRPSPRPPPGRLRGSGSGQRDRPAPGRRRRPRSSHSSLFIARQQVLSIACRPSTSGLRAPVEAFRSMAISHRPHFARRTSRPARSDQKARRSAVVRPVFAMSWLGVLPLLAAALKTRRACWRQRYSLAVGVPGGLRAALARTSAMTLPGRSVNSSRTVALIGPTTRSCRTGSGIHRRTMQSRSQ